MTALEKDQARSSLGSRRPPVVRDMRVWALAVGVGFAVLYAWTAARSVQGGDSGEWMTLAQVGGVAHPPGYPLLVALMRATNWLVPWGTVAWRASLVSVGCAAWALSILFLSLRRLGVSARASVLGVCALGLSPMYWRLATVAEAFALAALIVSLVVLTVVSAQRGVRWALLLGLVAALGIANHHTVVLLAPLFVLGLARSLPRVRDTGEGLRATAVFAAAAALGLLPYLTLLGTGSTSMWGVYDLSDLWHHLLRQAYGTFSLAHGPSTVAWWQHPWRYISTRSEDLLLFAPLAVVGVVAGLRTRRHRTIWIALVLSWLLSGPVFMARFNVPVDGDGLRMSVRFYLVPDVLLLLLAARGLDSVLERWPLRRALSLAVALLTLVIELRLAAPRARHDQSHLVARYVDQLLKESAERSLLMGAGDTLMGAMLYAQKVEQRRPDLLFVYPGMLPAPWYRQWLSRQPGYGPRLDLASLSSMRGTIDRVQERRPVRLIADLLVFDELQDLRDRTVADGAMSTLWPREQAPPQVDSLAARTQNCIDATLQGVDRQRLMIFADRFEGWVLEQLARQSLWISQAYLRTGQITKARAWRRQGAQLAPWL